MGRRRLLLGACGLMVATGLAFASVTAFWPLFVVAFVGTINPSSGDVTLFLPTEQAVLAETSAPHDRVSLFAWYNVAGTLAGALGALAAGLPDLASRKLGLPIAEAERAVFYAYSAVGLVSAAVYAGLSPTLEQGALADGRPRSPGVRDGGGAARGAGRRCQRHQRPAEPRGGPLSVRRGALARAVHVRLAARGGRGLEGDLRSGPVRTFLKSAT